MTLSQKAVEAAAAELEAALHEHADTHEGSLNIATRMLAAALAVDGLALQGWQPIESAPKDGTFILAYNVSHKDQTVVGWSDDVGMPEIAPQGCWTDAGNLNRAVNYLANANYFQFWKPLPPPPAASDGE